MSDLGNPAVFLRRLYDRAVEVADPMVFIPASLPPKPEGKVVVIGAGKASARMAEAVEAAWGPCEGYVITRYGYERPCAGIRIVSAAHPVPDDAGIAATQELLAYVRGLDEGTFVLALISGGGSSLLCAPAEGLTLADKQAVTAGLLASGAPIGEINGVRKQLSAVKGGKLAAAAYPARMLALALSDVPGDAPGDIASGPTVGDPGHPAKALETLEQWGVDIPQAVRAHLETGGDPVPPSDPRLAHAETRVVAAPAQSLAAAARIAEEAGCDVRMLGDDLEGEARDVAAQQAATALALQSELPPGAAPIVLMSGGELTVTRRGDGVGGPNAEFCLALAVALDGAEGIYGMAGDTDGVDGAAEVAGAIVSPQTLSKSDEDAQAALDRNDAHGFFGRLGDQMVPGPTLTNVNDFRAVLIFPKDKG